ncbi:hypothetical protein A0H81_07091 [Grifola frondosa]|uniref:non-specific serine/threonine protein kinase n=1 Tax=Grifola frondosa TaxID=5627 RepID=A0A1C7M8J6_GRIFR|nr:hypothetical protein A0H81_07091 [Grifola frondosa]
MTRIRRDTQDSVASSIQRPLRVVASGTLFLTHNLSLPTHPEPSTVVRAHSVSHVRGGPASTCLAVVAQFPSVDAMLVAPLGGNEEGAMIIRDLERERVSTKFCKIWKESGVPSAWVLHADDADSRTVINNNPLPDITHEEFVSLLGPLLVPENYAHLNAPGTSTPPTNTSTAPPSATLNNAHQLSQPPVAARITAASNSPAPFDWIHFEGRSVKTTLSNIMGLDGLARERKWRSHCVFSVDVGRRARQGVEALIPHADVIFLNKHYAQAHSPQYAISPRAFLLSLTVLASPHALLVAHWGEEGAAALSMPTREYFQSSGWMENHGTGTSGGAAGMKNGRDDVDIDERDVQSVRTGSDFWAGARSQTESSSMFTARALSSNSTSDSEQRSGPFVRPRTSSAVHRKGKHRQQHAEDGDSSDSDGTQIAGHGRTENLKPRVENMATGRNANAVVDDVGAQDAFVAGMMFALSRHMLPGEPYTPSAIGRDGTTNAGVERRAREGRWRLDECLRFATELAGRKARRKGWDGLADEMHAAGWVAGEARALMKCLRCGVNVPGIRMRPIPSRGGAEGEDEVEGDEEDVEEMVEPDEDKLLEYGVTQGTYCSGCGSLVKLTVCDAEALMWSIGTEIAKMHLADIIHGDLTTSNMMLRHPSSRKGTQLVLIDFGLAYTSTLVEDKAVDLYVLERAFSSTHPASEPLFASILKAYEVKMGREWTAISRRLDDGWCPFSDLACCSLKLVLSLKCVYGDANGAWSAEDLFSMLTEVSAALALGKEISAATPLLFLPGILGALQNIVDYLKQAKENKEACRLLAARTNDIARAVVTLAQEGDKYVNRSLSKNLETLHNALTEINDTVEKLANHKYHQRVIRRFQISGALSDLQAKLDDAWRQFDSAALVNIQQNQEEQRLFDGQLTLYRSSQIRLLHSWITLHGSKVEEARAIIIGQNTPVVLRRLKDGHDVEAEEAFKKDIASLKDIWIRARHGRNRRATAALGKDATTTISFPASHGTMPKCGDYGYWNASSAGPRFVKLGNVLGRLGGHVLGRVKYDAKPETLGAVRDMDNGMKRYAFDVGGDTPVAQVESTRVDWLPHENDTFYLLLSDGYFLALMNSIAIKDLVIVQRRTFHFQARADASGARQCRWHTVWLTSGTVQPYIAFQDRPHIFFHQRPVDNLDALAVPSAWGRWSRRSELRDAACPEELPGILAKVWCKMTVEYMRLSSMEADVLRGLRQAEFTQLERRKTLVKTMRGSKV